MNNSRAISTLLLVGSFLCEMCVGVAGNTTPAVEVVKKLEIHTGKQSEEVHKMSSIYDLTVNTAAGEAKQLSAYKGNVLLIVNVASKCGYTPQYEGLEALYKKYEGQGFKILAFPANDYGAQEPGSMEEIQNFCKVNYGVTFEIFEKVHAKGPEQSSLYQYLTTNANPTGDVAWNFEKFLIGKDGTIVDRFPSKVAPLDGELVSAVERELAK
jgi:glutathione peroxidase